MAFSTAFQRNAFQNNAFQIASVTTDVGGDGRPRSRRGRYWFDKDQAETLRKVLKELRKKKEAKEKSERQRILEARRAELEAEIFAMLMAWPEEQSPVEPGPYRPPLPLIHAFNFGQYITDREELEEIVQQLEELAQEVAAERQRLMEERVTMQ
jgi:hypothetical protein